MCVFVVGLAYVCNVRGGRRYICLARGIADVQVRDGVFCAVGSHHRSRRATCKHIYIDMMLIVVAYCGADRVPM